MQTGLSSYFFIIDRAAILSCSFLSCYTHTTSQAQLHSQTGISSLQYNQQPTTTTAHMHCTRTPTRCYVKLGESQLEGPFFFHAYMSFPSSSSSRFFHPSRDSPASHAANPARVKYSSNQMTITENNACHPTRTPSIKMQETECELEQ